ncbi:MAG: ABC transporter ATP-binding protein [Betaproteobacteria bacterium]
MTDAVRLDNVHFRYPGARAGVAAIDLTIAPGELLVCIGPSGCGKTTLLKLIAGFLTPDSGRIFLDGADVTSGTTRERGCGVVFQSYALFPTMNVWENVAYPLRVRSVPPRARRERAEAMLAVVGLDGFAERAPFELSGGQQQRVALARALVFEPKALLLDEPLSALDAATRLTMREEIRRVQQLRNIATLLITHDQDEALSLADRVAVMRDGRLQQVAAPQHLYDKPVDGFVATFVGRANLIKAVVAGPEAVDTPLGRLIVPRHDRPVGTRLDLLIRPERIDTATTAPSLPNTFDVRIARDAFHGASRQVEVALGAGSLHIETITRSAIERVRIPPEAVQFLPLH